MRADCANSLARSAATHHRLCGQTSGRACFFRPIFCSFPPNVCVTISGPLGVSNRDKRREDGESHDAERAISRTCAECWAEGSSAIAPASEIINAQQRYLGSQEPRRVRGSTVPHRPHQRGAAFDAALAQSFSTQLFARQRWQASASASRRLPPNLPPVYARRAHAEAQQERPCLRVQGSFQARQRRIAAADRLTPS